jgi:hypothetical protein
MRCRHLNISIICDFRQVLLAQTTDHLQLHDCRPETTADNRCRDTAVVDEAGERSLKVFKLRNFPIDFRKAGQCKRFDVCTSALTIAPERKKTGHLMHREPESTGAMNEAQDVDIGLSIDAIIVSMGWRANSAETRKIEAAASDSCVARDST